MEADTNKRTDYERGYRDGYLDGVKDLAGFWPKPETKGPRCTKCGISFEGFMGYVCSRSHCPMMPVAY